MGQGQGVMAKNLVLGCVQSWLGRYARDDIVKLVSDNFLDKEIFDGLKVLSESLSLDAPKQRHNTKKQVAVKVWASEMYDIMIKEDYIDKLPEFVVSSQELQRVPLALLSGANDVVPVCSKMNTLEKKMEELVDTMMKFSKSQLLTPVNAPVTLGPSGTYAGAVHGGHGQPGAVQHAVGQQVQVLPTTPGRGRVGSFSEAGLALKRKHDENIVNSFTGIQQLQQHQLQQQQGNEGQHGHGAVVGAGGNQQHRVPRKQCYGA